MILEKLIYRQLRILRYSKSYLTVENLEGVMLTIIFEPIIISCIESKSSGVSFLD